MFRRLIFLSTAFSAIFLTACKEKEQPVRELLFEVRPGESTKRIAQRLDSLDVITHPRKFITEARLKGLDKSLQSGVYRLHTRMSEDSVLLILSKGAIATITVTIPEGLMLKEIASRLADSGVVNKDTFLELSKSRTLLDEFNVPFKSFEGILYPDTYKFPLGISTQDVIRIMARRFFEVAEPYIQKVSLDTLVIIASIVEREAYLDTERPIVASVFYNRLKKGMAFESCATVEYVLPEHKERLTYSDLRVNSPYNTYLHAGLPPGPICSPGNSSLEAAANPAHTDYLYFVSKGDGSHHFSRTAAEHERMKRKINKERSRNEP